MMVYAFWGTLAGVLVLLLAAAHQAIPTFGAPEPTGRHHKPTHRQAERDEDEERIFVHVRADTSEAQAAIDHIQQKLAAASADVFGGEDEETGQAGHVSLSAAQAQARGWTDPAIYDAPLMPLPPEVEHSGWDWPALAEEAIPETHCVNQSVHLTPEPEDPPEPAPLFNTSADHWREDTLLGMPAVKL